MLFQAFFTRTALFVAVFFAVVRFAYGCASLALRTNADDTFLASQVFLALSKLSERHTRFRAFASFPDASKRLQSQSGQFHASLRTYPPLAGAGVVSRGAASAPRRRAISDGRQPRSWKLRARGHPGGPAGVFCHARLGRGRCVRLADSRLKFLGAEKTAYEL